MFRYAVAVFLWFLSALSVLAEVPEALVSPAEIPDRFKVGRNGSRLIGQVPYNHDEHVGVSRNSEWVVHYYENQFDEEKVASIGSPAFDREGNIIGSFAVRVTSRAAWVAAEKGTVDLVFHGHRGLYPDCDYDNARYIVDGGRPHFFPSFSNACKIRRIADQDLKRLRNGSKLKVATITAIAEVSLEGFDEAYEKAFKWASKWH